MARFRIPSQHLHLARLAPAALSQSNGLDVSSASVYAVARTYARAADIDAAGLDDRAAWVRNGAPWWREPAEWCERKYLQPSAP